MEPPPPPSSPPCRRTQEAGARASRVSVPIRYNMHMQHTSNTQSRCECKDAFTHSVWSKRLSARAGVLHGHQLGHVDAGGL
eukprot:scaffold41783_cov63-Phaeocystis_antarctica.AAC.3